MESRRLGADGPELSVVGLGCNNFGGRIDETQTGRVVHAALDAGITHFDTAESYGDGRSEAFLGKALGARRDDVLIATKFAPRPPDEPYRPGLLRRRILDGCEMSLKRLCTDRIDLYYQHRPDPAAPVEEALAALGELVAAGKVVHVACSNFSAEQIDGAASTSAAADIPAYVACQIHWNLLFREVEEELVPAVRRQQMGIVPYFPLESGLLTGKYRPDQYPEGSRLATTPRFGVLASESNFAYIERLRRFAEERGHSLLELAFGWLLAQDGVASVIAGATTAEQIAQNVAAGQAWRLSAQDLEELPQID
jgi:aryl-alcohol dehydrogenase-like predicted oxidoreductase